MTEKQETWSDKAWSWIVRLIGAGVFVGAAATDFLSEDGKPSYYIAFFGLVLMVFPIGDVRTMVRNWRRNGNGNGKETP